MEKSTDPGIIDSPTEDRPTPGSKKTRFRVTHILTFFILFALWIAFSGRFDLFHIVLGILSCTIVIALSGDMMFTKRRPRGLLLGWFRWMGYIPWLLYQIFLANLQVMYIVFHPRMNDLINPRMIAFDTHLKSDFSRWTFANSITLTPGTITVNATALGRFTVHCITDASGEALPGKMEQRIARLFRE